MEKSEVGVNLNGPVPPANPDCWPLTAPVPMTSFRSPQHEAHMDVAPAWEGTQVGTGLKVSGTQALWNPQGMPFWGDVCPK